MEGGVDDKKYATDTRQLGEGLIADQLLKNFTESPISARCMMKDICAYAPGDLNKIGKEGKTSWDTLTYSILMSHNAYMHIDAVQQANRAFDAGAIPKMLLAHLKHDLVHFTQALDAIFATSDKGRSIQLINEYENFWHNIMGTRGFTGPKALNANTATDKFFADT
jgi:hypothetical protein